MRLSKLFLGLPLILLSSNALAHEEEQDPDYEQKPEIGISLEGYRSGTGVVSGPGMMGGYLGMHGRLGRRVALGFGLDQGYGEDASGYKRFDIGWNLPKLYLYLNPSSKSQLYVTTGLDMRVSHFEDNGQKVVPAGTNWGFFYMGSFFGGGLEQRIDKSMALRVEARWFMRGRASGQAQSEPALDPAFSKDTLSERGASLSLGLTFF